MACPEPKQTRPVFRDPIHEEADRFKHLIYLVPETLGQVAILTGVGGRPAVMHGLYQKALAELKVICRASRFETMRELDEYAEYQLFALLMSEAELVMSTNESHDGDRGIRAVG